MHTKCVAEPTMLLMVFFKYDGAVHMTILYRVKLLTNFSV